MTPTTIPALPSPVTPDNGDNAGPDRLLAFIGEAAQILQIDALNRAGHKLDVADGAKPVGAVGFGAAAHGELLLRIRKFALDAFALVEQRRQAGRHLVDRHAQFGRRGLGELHDVIGVLARALRR